MSPIAQITLLQVLGCMSELRSQAALLVKLADRRASSDDARAALRLVRQDIADLLTAADRLHGDALDIVLSDPGYDPAEKSDGTPGLPWEQ